jgi:hypothetical protein
MPRGAFAKNRRADANHRSSFFDRNCEVVRHTHRQLSFSFSKRTFRSEFVSQLA